MNIDDSFELFGSSLAIEKTDENTIIFYSGSGNTIPLRPYIIPDDNWFNKYNNVLSIHDR